MTASRIAKLAVLATSTVVCVLMAEVVVRLTHPQTLSIWSHTRDGFVIHQSDVREYMTPAGKRIDTNSVGMRDREHSIEKPPDTFRILLLGDSFMEAVQVDWEDTLAANLEARLDEVSDKRVEILNVSVSGWGTDDELTYYLRHLRPYSPDLILLCMTLHNDVSDNLWMKFHSLEGGEIVEKPREEVPTALYARQQVKEWLASSSHLYRLLVGSLRADVVRVGAQQLDRHLSELLRRKPSPEIEAGWVLTLKLLDRMHAKGAEADAEMAVFLVPLALQASDLLLREFLEAHLLDRSQLALERPQEIMLKWGVERGVKVVDLLPEFREWVSANPDEIHLAADGHWNERGHELAAKVVGRELVAANLIPVARDTR